MYCTAPSPSRPLIIIHLDDVVGRGQAARRHVGLLHRARAANVGLIEQHAGHELRHRVDAATGRQRIERLTAENLDARRARNVPTGDSPVTVTVSSRIPTRISMLIVAVKSVGSSRPSRTNALNPDSVNRTE